jgi:peptidyl-prolyl cis-trans isomerase D
MLQAINDRIKGIVGGVIIFLISITFMSWGIQEYLTSAQEKFAAKIGDTEVSMREFENAVSNQRQRYQEMFNGQVPFDDQSLKKQVLDKLVMQRVLEQAVVGEGYRIPDKMLGEEIRNMAPFQQDGKFVEGLYRSTLESQNMSAAEFEQLVRRDLMRMQLTNGVNKSTVVPDAAIQTFDRYQNQTRDVSYLLFSSARYAAEVGITPDEVQSYYNEHLDRYQYPEQVKIAYVELRADDIKTDAPVDEEQLHRLYDEYVAGLSATEQRKARHILIGLGASDNDQARADKKKKAEDILAQLRKGKPFAELAKQHSQDPGSAEKGGDLGWVSKGMMVPAFEQALFALKKNEISDIVTSEFGYHIIQAEDIKSAQPASFADKKAELLRSAQQQDIDNLFYERSERIATLAYENDQSLQPVADALGLTIKQTDWFNTMAGPGMAMADAVRKAAFSESVLKEGRNSEVIELDKNHIVVLRVAEHQPAKPRSLDEVRTMVELSLKAEKAKSRIQAASLQALADIQSGKTAESIATEQRVELKKAGSVTRTAAGVDRRILQAAFSMNKPDGKASYDTVELADGIALVAVHAVAEGQLSTQPEALQAAARNLSADIAARELLSVMNYLKSESDVVIGKDLQ